MGSRLYCSHLNYLSVCVSVFAIKLISFIDLVYATSIYDDGGSTESKRVLVKSFSESFARIRNEPALLGGLPDCNKPPYGEGLSVDLTGKERFLGFATSAVKLLSKCLTEGTLYVEGLLDASCIMAVCKLLCWGDDDLHMVDRLCCDLPQIFGLLSAICDSLFQIYI